jgi:hypothetical protein
MIPRRPTTQGTYRSDFPNERRPRVELSTYYAYARRGAPRRKPIPAFMEHLSILWDEQGMPSDDPDTRVLDFHEAGADIRYETGAVRGT